ncbi:MAG TPA: FMN-binding negative transcriptional regulator [Alphaproteobacteria bacterium]|nr:FMN-binding negative transcriptional regulator [Alphaproteobacteria bacterium]
MYVPDAFAETNTAVLHDLIESYSFGALVTGGGDEPYATHVPFLLDRERGAHGTLITHLSRGNPHWRQIADAMALVIFSGPHGYVSPSWYEVHPAVPTWNYAAVHAYGRVRLIEDPAKLEALVKRLVRTHEGGRADAWSTDGLPPAFMTGMLRGIVGLEIPVERLEGKFKLSQNRKTVDRKRVIARLAGSSSESERELAEFMTRHAAPGE